MDANEGKGLVICDNCMGCGVCKNVCHQNAISMKSDETGFEYPLINKEKCIKCNLCKKKCPVLNNPKQKDYDDNVYAYCTKNFETWVNSTSGGAFYDICATWESIYSNTIIYGAYLDENFNAYHIGVNFSEINKLQKSKYIQSNISKVMQEVRKNLDDNMSVIFSGTPCQIAGIKKYLNKEYEKLLLVDVVCHGVGSSDVLRSCIKYQEDIIAKKIVEYKFRFKNKKKFRPSQRYSVEYKTNDGQKVISKDDIYMRLFLKGSCLRKSCLENCEFKAANAYSDISLADLNNKSKIIPKQYDEKNYSAIFFHTSKGRQIIKTLESKGNLIKCCKSEVIKYNMIYFQNNEGKNNRKMFFERYISNKGKIDTSVEPYCVEKNKRNLTEYIPYFIKYLINNLRKGTL